MPCWDLLEFIGGLLAYWVGSAVSYWVLIGVYWGHTGIYWVSTGAILRVYWGSLGTAGAIVSFSGGSWMSIGV